MLERLNGDEKGDAIVSVRGYEPIWTIFTPSFKLKDLYFKDGRADMSKREAVLFDKNEYVFDISGTSTSDEDLIMDAIEKDEQMNEEERFKDKTITIELDKQWNEIFNDIHKRLYEFVDCLTGEHRKAVLEARLENKATILYSITDKYNTFVATEIKNMADYISRQCQELLAIQQQGERK